jgi:hypothetical protein
MHSRQQKQGPQQFVQRDPSKPLLAKKLLYFVAQITAHSELCATIKKDSSLQSA